MAFKQTTDGSKTCVRFSGRMDTETTLKLQQQILQTADQLHAEKEHSPPAELVFDLGEVDFVASAFLRVCLEAFKKVGAENFSIINVSPSVMMVFEISGLEKLVKIQ